MGKGLTGDERGLDGSNWIDRVAAGNCASAAFLDVVVDIL